MEKVNIPTNCPSCTSELNRVNNQLFCTNPNCLAQGTKKVENYAKVLKIKGLGEKTIEKLDIRSIEDIYLLSKEDIINTLGNKLGEKLYEEIEKSKNIPFYTFLAAAGIPLIGQAVANKLSFINDADEITFEICRDAGIGAKATSNLLNWLDEEYYTKLINLPIVFVTQNKLDNVEAIKVCITGKIPGYTKSSLAAYLSKYSVIVEDDVNKKTNYLICDVRKNSIKEQKALKLNIQIVTLQEFENIIKEIK